MALTDYTSYDEVRAVLGVSVDEIDDVTLGLGVYSLNLLAELEDIADALPEDYAIVLAVDGGSRTEKQRKLYNAVQLFAPYAAGKQLASSLPIFSPKAITDGKSGFTRYSDSPYKQSIAECLKQYSANRQRLIDAYASFKDTSAALSPRPYLTVSVPTTNPVTG
jgi:hypothetical protein